MPPTGGIMAVAVKPETAAGGQIQVGDRVRVISSLALPSGEVRAETILVEALVHDLGRATQLGLNSTVSGERPPAPIATVSLVVKSAAEMERLAAAKTKGTIDLVLLPADPAQTLKSTSAPPIATDYPAGPIAPPAETPAGGR